MIDLLSGTVILARESGRGCEVVIDVGGVGFRVTVLPSAMERISSSGEKVTLFTHLCVREDDLSLYGFETSEERDLFEMLIKASGVGPKVGMAILATHSPDSLLRLIEAGDAGGLTLVPGIGLKRAERLILELRDKIGAMATGRPSIDSRSGHGDVAAALAGLGYSAPEIRLAIAALPDDGDPETLLRDALKVLATQATGG